MTEVAVERLRLELRAFYNTGLNALRADLLAGKEDIKRLPGRLSWSCCPLSYRLGHKGSVDRDSEGQWTNEFTWAWDGLEQDYLDEAVVLREVEQEIQRRLLKAAKKELSGHGRRGKGSPRKFRKRQAQR